MSALEAGTAVVVTGGAGGIGMAFARRFRAEGASVLLSDVDGTALRTAGAELGVPTVVADAASPDGVEELLTAARAELGGVDVYCANAGVAPHGGPEAPEDDWAAAWDVNVMAHVRAANALLPEWLERGRGHFVATVSAAGLLTSLGSAPYSVTKHAALAFAEWLSATYRHRGITVQAVCPQGVRTRMLADTGKAGELLMGHSAIEPGQVADALLDAMADNRFLVLPHAEVAEFYNHRAADTDRWLGGMNKLQRKVEEAGAG